MRITAYIFLLFSLTISGCDYRIKRVPIRGTWQIQQISYRPIGQQDSVVRGDLGYLSFSECDDETNSHSLCVGERVYADGEKSTFYFRTMTEYTQEKEPIPMLEIAHMDMEVKSAERVADELRGRHFLLKFTDKEMILNCLRCSIGNQTLDRFELHAVKVKE